MDITDLRFEPPFVKMSINTILSGAISKASGGDFYQGAMSALVVYLYNELKGALSEKEFKYLQQQSIHNSKAMKGVPAVMGGNAYNEIDKATALSPETKKAISKGADNISTVTGIASGVCAETVVLSELSIPLAGISVVSKGVSIHYSDNTVEQNTLSIVRDGGIDMISPTGDYRFIFLIEAYKTYLNSISK